MGLREEKKRATRQGIMDTTLSMFRGNGFDRTRVQDIADRLRISEATFFNYFPTKHSVLEAAADEMIDQSIELLRRDVADGDRPVPERLETLARTFAANFSGDRELAELLASHTQFFSATPNERRDRAHLLVTELFTEGQRRGEIRDDVPATQLATLSMAVTMAAVQSWVAEADPQQALDERLVQATEVLLTGCVVRE
jgi:AcrR family transcriptional regulator